MLGKISIKAKISFAILFLFYLNIHLQAEILGVYRIETDKSIIKAKGKVSTGFVVEKDGEKVVVTALHGVVGYNSIQMSDKVNFIEKLSIDLVDTKRDLAILKIDDKNKEKLSSLKFISGSSNYRGLHVIGYPYGITESLESKNIQVRSRKTRKLCTLLPPTLEKKISQFAIPSPSLNTTVLSIDGALTHGYSGAPLIDGTGKVIGIVNGGLQGATTNISWAIPWSSWKNFRKLKKNEIKILAVQSSKSSITSSFNTFQSSTGLIEWQEPKAGYMTWKKAQEYVAQMNNERLMGHNNWRLPKIGELEDLREFIKNNPGVYNDVDKLYRTDEEESGMIKDKAYVVNLGNANIEWSDFSDQIVFERSKEDAFAVRLVRDVE